MDMNLLSSTTPFTPPTTEADKLSWLRLIRSHRVGPTTFHRLLATHGSAEASLAELPRIAAMAGVSGYRSFTPTQAEAEWVAGERAGLTALFWGTQDYPKELLHLGDAPPLLWRRGGSGVLQRPMIALVGARNASSLGVRMARRLALGLGEAGLVTASGLARGIDTAAHEGALLQGTVAVLAGGADQIYPPENADLAARIAESGALLSEMPPGHLPQARNFPARNRLISGLSLGVVVVEAAERSGSMITARTALDQGREVMAVPGHPVDPRAAGCNLMIRDGCTLVRHVDDILEALSSALRGAEAARTPLVAKGPAPAPAPRRRNHLLSAEQLPPLPGGAAAARALAAVSRPVAGLRQIILARLSASPLGEDQLSRDLALPPESLIPDLLALELDGEIERRAGGYLARSA